MHFGARIAIRHLTRVSSPPRRRAREVDRRAFDDVAWLLPGSVNVPRGGPVNVKIYKNGRLSGPDVSAKSEISKSLSVYGRLTV